MIPAGARVAKDIFRTMGTTQISLATRAGRPALLLLFAVALGLASATAASAKDRPGPGPFNTVLLADGGIVMRVAAGASSVELTGAVAVSAAGASGEWIPFDQKPVVDDGGSRLVVRGTVGGVPVDEYFVQGDQRRLLVRNGDGRTTELDVLRFGDSLLIISANRRPGAPVRSAAGTYEREVDALADGAVTVRLPTQTTAGYDVVVAATLPDLPEFALGQTISVTATEAGGGRTYFAGTFGTLHVAFAHFTLPEGTYTLSARASATYGDIYGATTTVASQFDSVASIDVARDRRIFAVTLPPHHAPPIQEVDVVVDNLAELSPTFGSRVQVRVSLLSTDGLVSSFTTRDVGDPDPLTVLMPAVEGEYTVIVDAGRPSSDANGVSTNLELRLDGQRLPGPVRVTIPPLVRVSGTLRDPGFELASSPDPYSGITPTHVVSTTATNGGGAATASASAYLKGFARSYTLLAPAGSTVRAGGNVTIALGRPRTEPDAFENDTAGLRIDAAPPEGVACDAGCTVDLAVPLLPELVTISGRLVDAKGKGVKSASVGAYGDDPASLGGATVSAYVLTDPKGRFTLRLPRASAYRLLVSAY